MNIRKTILTSVFLYEVHKLLYPYYRNKLKNSEYLIPNTISRVFLLIKMINFISIINSSSKRNIIEYLAIQYSFNKISNFIPNARIILALISIIVFSTSIFAGNKKLPIPRFASIKANEVNARNGPAIRSPIEWIFIKKGEPIEIIDEYEQWRKIRDINGEGGWVHSSVLSGKRYVIIKNKKPIFLYKKSQKDSELIAEIHPQVRCQLSKTKENWCKIQCKDYIGWVLTEQVWGLYKDEQI